MATQAVVKFGQLTDEQITLIKKKVLYQAQKDEFFAPLAKKEPWKKGSKTMSYRRLLYPKLKPSDVAPIAEGVAPRPSKIGYATFEVEVFNYRDKVPYTREAVEFSIDNVVHDAAETLAYIFAQKMDYIKGKPFISSRAAITYDTSVIKTMRKANIVLQKNEAKKWEGGLYLMLATPEIIEKLKDELTALGVALDEATKEELTRGIVGKKYGFAIKSVPSDIFHLAGGKHMVTFMGRTFQGTSPITVHQLGDIEIINNPLGSAVLVDEDGNITADDNKQIGSIAMNANGLAAVVNDDLCILNCEVTVATIEGSNLAAAERTGYVSSSGSPDSFLTISPVKATDGEAIASPTIVVKVKDSSGATVTAESGKYKITAGVKYYFSVAKTGYVTATGYFNAQAMDTALVVPLTAS